MLKTSQKYNDCYLFGYDMIIYNLFSYTKIDEHKLLLIIIKKKTYKYKFK